MLATGVKSNVFMCSSKWSNYGQTIKHNQPDLLLCFFLQEVPESSLVWSGWRRAGPTGGDVEGQGRSCLKPAPLPKVKKLNKAKTLLPVMEVGQNGE